MGRLRHAVAAAVPFAAWYAMALIVERLAGGGYSVEVRSLTPDELADLLSYKASAALGPYYHLLLCANGVEPCSEERLRPIREAVAAVECASAEDREECVSRVMSEDPSALLEAVRRYGVVEPVPSMLFIGPPGIGKSESVVEAARRIARENHLEFVDLAAADELMLRRVREARHRYFVFVDLRLTSVEPADLMGIPRRAEVPGGEVSRYIPFDWAELLSTGPGMLFLDELTNVRREDVLSAAYQLVLDRKSGFVRFDPGVIVVAAGNAPEHSPLARKLPAPLHTRFEVFNVVAPKPEQWFRYMNRRYGSAWSRVVWMYIAGHRGDWVAAKIPSPVILGPEEQVPTPRGWTRAAVQLHSMFAGRGGDRAVIEALAKAFARGGCQAVRSLLPGDPGYDELRDAKQVCEVLAGFVGSTVAQQLSIELGIPAPDPEKVMEDPDRTRRALEEAMDTVVEALERVKSLAREGAQLVETMLSEFRAKTPRARERLARSFAAKYAAWLENRVGSEEEAIRLAPKIAKVIDGVVEFLGGEPRPWMVNIVGTMLLPICTRRYTKAKVEVLKESRYLPKMLDRLVDILVGGVGQA